MNDADLVRGFEGLGDLARDGKGIVERQGAAGDALREILVLDALHHQGIEAAALLETENLRDVGMVEGRQRLRLALEAHQAIGIAGNRFGQHLQRHVAIELGVAGAIHLAHPAGSEQGDHVVGADAGAGGERHVQQRIIGEEPVAAYEEASISRTMAMNRSMGSS